MSRFPYFLLGFLIFILVSAGGFWLAFEYASTIRGPGTPHDLAGAASRIFPLVVAFFINPVVACGVAVILGNFIDKDKSNPIYIGVLVGPGILAVFIVIAIVITIVAVKYGD